MRSSGAGRGGEAGSGWSLRDTFVVGIAGVPPARVRRAGETPTIPDMDRRVGWSGSPASRRLGSGEPARRRRSHIWTGGWGGRDRRRLAGWGMESGEPARRRRSHIWTGGWGGRDRRRPAGSGMELGEPARRRRSRIWTGVSPARVMSQESRRDAGDPGYGPAGVVVGIAGVPPARVRRAGVTPAIPDMDRRVGWSGSLASRRLG